MRVYVCAEAMLHTTTVPNNTAANHCCCCHCCHCTLLAYLHTLLPRRHCGSANVCASSAPVPFGPRSSRQQDGPNTTFRTRNAPRTHPAAERRSVALSHHLVTGSGAALLNIYIHVHHFLAPILGWCSRTGEGRKVRARIPTDFGCEGERRRKKMAR